MGLVGARAEFKSVTLGRGGGLVVSALAYYYKDPSSNPAGY